MRPLTRLNRSLGRLTGRQLLKVPTPPIRKPIVYRHVEVYAALAELRRRELEVHDAAAPIDLRLAELRVFSQNGEDGVLAELIRRLPVADRSFVEFGVEDGTQCNTRLLAEVLGWAGVYFEPHAPDHDRLAARWEHSPQVTVINEAVTPQSVAEQFERAGVPDQLGVLSIDVDGQDYWIWEALPSRFRPAIVVIECNASFPAHEPLVERQGLPWSPDFSDTCGASIAALHSLGNRRGYTLVHVDLSGVNAFFVRRDLLADRHVIGVTDRRANYNLAGLSHPPTPVRETVAVPVVEH